MIHGMSDDYSISQHGEINKPSFLAFMTASFHASGVPAMQAIWIRRISMICSSDGNVLPFLLESVNNPVRMRSMSLVSAWIPSCEPFIIVIPVSFISCHFLSWTALNSLLSSYFDSVSARRAGNGCIPIRWNRTARITPGMNNTRHNNMFPLII